MQHFERGGPQIFVKLSFRELVIFNYEFSLAVVNCGVSWGSVLGLLLFLLYINYLSQAIKFCKVHHFADGTNVLCHSNSIKNLNTPVNADLKNLVNWLNAKKFLFNVKRTEMVIFISKQKKVEFDLNLYSLARNNGLS